MFNKSKKLNFRTLFVFVVSISFLLPFITSCEYFVNVDFEIANNGNDTLVLTGWNGANRVRYTSPYTSNSGDIYNKTTISSFRAGGSRSISVTEEQAFTQLMSDFDSVQLSRSSDGASTIIYRHNENASEAQQYFFTRKAWKCNPEGEELKDRTYTLILTKEMFR